jgi:hypothetical protein
MSLIERSTAWGPARKGRRLAAALLAACTAAAALGLGAIGGARAQEVPTVPGLHPLVPRGSGKLVDVAARKPSAKTLDGRPSDWAGENPLFGGLTLYSAGELIYQDHLFDARGPASDETVRTVGAIDTAAEAHPGATRAESIARVLAADPAYGLNGFQYGAVPLQDEADLLEFRVAADKASLWLLARTTTMNDETPTAVVLLLDTAEGAVERQVPFDAGITTTKAELAAFLTSTGVGRLVDLRDGSSTAFDVAADTSGYVNAVEGRVPLSAIGADGDVGVAVVTGLFDAGSQGLADLGAKNRVANVGFRPDEPLRGSWFEYHQALKLNGGTVDDFFVPADIGALRGGATQRFTPGPGYQDRMFLSTEDISIEDDINGLYQHFGAYLPKGYKHGTTTPATMFLRGSAGTAHEMPWLLPGLLRDVGDAHNNVIVSPSGRAGDLTWYYGASHMDLLQALASARSTFHVDAARTYVSGYSMGGWGTLLMSILYPDVFAAGFNVNGTMSPSAGPTGTDMEDCNDFQTPYTGLPHPALEWPQSPCYLGTYPSHSGDPADTDLRRVAVNMRHTPLVEYRSAQDNATLVTNSLVMIPTLDELGYRYRMYLHPVGDHYTVGVMDEFAEGAAYINRYKVDPNPARVTYKRDMRLEHAVETTMFRPYGPPVPDAGKVAALDFDKAFWVSEITPEDMEKGEALVDATSLAISQVPVRVVPEVGGPAAPGQTGPYVMKGQAWETTTESAPAVRNAFEATTTGTTAVRFDLERMDIDVARVVQGRVQADKALTLRLQGNWDGRREVVVNGVATVVEPSNDVVEVALQSGTSTIEVRPVTLSAAGRGRGRSDDSTRTLAQVEAGTADIGGAGAADFGGPSGDGAAEVRNAALAAAGALALTAAGALAVTGAAGLARLWAGLGAIGGIVLRRRLRR